MDKIKKIIFTLLGLLMILNILGLDLDVFAIDYGYDYSAFSIRYGNSNFCDIVSDGTGISVTYSDLSTNTSGWLALDSTADNNCQPLGRLSYHVRGSSTYIYKSGNTYTFRFTIDFEDEREAQDYMKYYSVDFIQANTTTTSVTTGADLIDDYNFYMKEGSVSNRVLVYFVFTPNTDLKYVGINTSPTDLVPTSNTSLYVNDDKVVRGSVNYEYLKITYTEGSNAVIQQQTAVIQEQTDKIFQSVEDLKESLLNNNQQTNDVLTDESPPEGTNQFVDDMVGYLPPGPLDSILNLPLQFLNKYVEGLAGTCSSINIPLPFVDKTLTLDCPNRILSQIDGIDYLYTLIGVVGASYIMLKYLMSLYVWVDRTLTLRENNEPGYFDEP